MPMTRTRPHTPSNQRQPQRGVALVEFALTLSVFVLLLVGILEFGVIMFTKNDVTEAARDGARQAAVNSSGSNGSCTSANNWLGAACTLAPSGSRICIRALDGNLDIGSAVRVRVTYDYRWVTALGAAIGHGPTLTLTGTSVMRVEQQGSNLPGGATGGDVCVTKP